MVKPFVCTMVMAAAVYASSFIVEGYSNIVSFIIKAITGIIVYAVSSIVCKSEGLFDVLSLVKRK